MGDGADVSLELAGTLSPMYLSAWEELEEEKRMRRYEETRVDTKGALYLPARRVISARAMLLAT